MCVIVFCVQVLLVMCEVVKGTCTCIMLHTCEGEADDVRVVSHVMLMMRVILMVLGL